MGLLKRYQGYTGNQLTNMSSFLAKKKAAGMPITQRDTDLIYGSVLGGQADAYGDMLFRNQAMKKEENRWNKTFEQNKEIADANMEAQKQTGRGNAVQGLVQTGLLANQMGAIDSNTIPSLMKWGKGLLSPSTTTGTTTAGAAPAVSAVGGAGAAPIAGSTASSGLGGSYVAGQGYVPATDIAAGGAVGAGESTSTGLLGTAGTALAPVAGGVAGGMIGRAISPWGEGHMGGERNTAGAIGAGAGAIIGGYAAAGTYVGGPVGAVIGGIVGALVAWIDW